MIGDKIQVENCGFYKQTIIINAIYNEKKMSTSLFKAPFLVPQAQVLKFSMEFIAFLQFVS